MNRRSWFRNALGMVAGGLAALVAGKREVQVPWVTQVGPDKLLERTEFVAPAGLDTWDVALTDAEVAAIAEGSSPPPVRLGNLIRSTKATWRCRVEQERGG